MNKTQTNTILAENTIIVGPINEQTNNEYIIHSLDEATDIFSYDEIIDYLLKFYFEECKKSTNNITPSFDFLRCYIERFYDLNQKSIDEVLGLYGYVNVYDGGRNND